MAKITLKAARISAGYTQEKLAKTLGINRTTVRRWESGETLIKPVHLYALSKLTGFAVDDFILPTEYA